MGYTAKFDLSDITKDLETLDKNIMGATAFGVYDGAKVVADATRRAINEIRTSPVNIPGNRRAKRFATEEEKAALLGAGVGIARFRKSGFTLNTLIGPGKAYTSIRGRKVAVNVIANAINSGTSFMEAQPVYNRAHSKIRKAVESAINQTVIKKLDKR